MNPITRPPPLPVPDKEAWEAKHGTQCYDLEHPQIPSYLQQAAQLHEEDWTELGNVPVHEIHAEMDGICEAVASLFRLTDRALVAYDHPRRVFVAMPYGEARRR